MTHSTSITEITVRQVPERGQFSLLDGSREIGKAAYREYTVGASPQRIFYHTVINPDFGGQGLGSILVTHALDQTVAAGIAPVPICPFIKDFITKHPEYAKHSDDVAAEHLQFLEDSLAGD